jgi:hypothetical protein
MDVVGKVLKYSVNTWDQGFMDKLYASPNAVSFQSVMMGGWEGERMLMCWYRLGWCRSCCLLR